MQILSKNSRICQNTEGVNKQAETDLIDISGDNWHKVVKIGKNTEGVIKSNFIKKLFLRLQKNKKKLL